MSEFDYRSDEERLRSVIYTTVSIWVVLFVLLTLPIPLNLIFLVGLGILIPDKVSNACEWITRPGGHCFVRFLKVSIALLIYPFRYISHVVRKGLYLTYRQLDKHPLVSKVFTILLGLLAFFIVTGAVCHLLRLGGYII